MNKVREGLANLQQRPEVVRRNITFLSSLAIVLVIGLIWLANVGGGGSDVYVADGSDLSTPFETILEESGLTAQVGSLTQ